MKPTRANLWSKFQRPEDGASAVEYALIIALIAAVIVGVVAVVGTRTGGAFQEFCDALAAANGGAC